MNDSDTRIKQAVVRELKWDTRVDETTIGVAVTQGVVILTGSVRQYAERLAAENAAHRVAGVLDVANDIVVRTPGSAGLTDAEIATAVRGALEWHALVPERRIRSTVTDGWVTLEGDVDYGSQKEDAERAVRYLAGVRGITNQIEVDVPKVLPYDVRKAIEEALVRHAQHESKHIALDVQDGRVTLKGTVESWAEKKAILGAASHTAGVRSVEDLLRIEPRST